MPYDLPTPPQRRPRPEWTRQPFPPPLSAEPVSGVFRPHTGRTRRYVKWSFLVGAAVTLLTPVCDAVAKRIAPAPSEVGLANELRALRELLTPVTDGGR